MTLSDLISLKGLVTVSSIVAVTIKSLHVTWNVNKKNVHVNGNNNTVNVVYNEVLAKTQKNFSLLWNLLAVAIFLTYPLLGSAYNFSLEVLAFVGVPIALVALVSHCVRYGVARRIWHLFYVIGAAAACLLAWAATPFLDYTANQAAPVYAHVVTTVDLFSRSANLFDIVLFVSKNIGYPMIAVMGFSLLFLSVLYLVFAFIKERDFNDALRFSVFQVVMGAAGYILACNFFIAMYSQNFAYVKAILVAPFGPFLN
ncbi:hypothetical protein ACR42A_35350 [Burkholderia gladioli]|uniref:hypothetical protein n=1 Tax=Burkholderia gladioli TaxID=28095 RepID=UPI001640ABB2|nr:hypothetical protein [Burkholderia gladioli]